MGESHWLGGGVALIVRPGANRGSSKRLGRSWTSGEGFKCKVVDVIGKVGRLACVIWFT